MDNEELEGVKFSQFPSATPGDSDEVVGLHAGDNARFSVANFVLAIRQGLANIFVPKTDVGTANGVAGLDSTGKVPSSQLPTIPSSNITYDPTTSGASATNVQDALDEAFDDLDGKQDTITASGILKGDGQGGVSAATPGTDYQAPLTIDATPTANSTNPVQSGGVYADVRTRVPVYGLGKNLLDNAYFVGGGSQLGDGVFPINQRGQTSYSGTGYGIDRWKQARSEIQQVVMSDCLRMNAASAVSSGNLIYCYFYCPKLPAGTYTLSFIVKEATGSGGWYYSSNASSGYNVGNVRLLPGLVTKTFTATGNETSQVFYLWHQGALAVGDHLGIIAAKLECGSEQTLAHQENNEWVLNEIPDYGEELVKCQRYYFDTGANSTNGQIIIGLSNVSGQVLSLYVPVPVSMNAANAMTITGIIGWIRGEGGAIGGYSLQSASVLFKNTIAIGVNASYGAMRMYGAYFTKLIFSAEP